MLLFIIISNPPFNLLPTFPTDLDRLWKIIHVIVKSQTVLSFWEYNIYIREDKHKEITKSPTNRMVCYGNMYQGCLIQETLENCYLNSVRKYVKALRKGKYGR